MTLPCLKSINYFLSFLQKITDFKEVILIINEKHPDQKFISSLGTENPDNLLLKSTKKKVKKAQSSKLPQAHLTLLGIPYLDKPFNKDYQNHFDLALIEINKLIQESELLCVDGLIEHLNKGVIVFDRENKVSHINQSAERLYDVKQNSTNDLKTKLYKKGTIEPIAVEEEPSTLALNGFYTTDEIYSVYTAEFPNGRFVSVNASPVKNAANEIIAAVVTLIDITLELEKEEEQKQQIDLLNQASALAKVGYWELDIDREQVYWSEVTRKIHETEKEYNPRLQEGINFYDEESRPLIEELVSKGMQTGEGWDAKLKIVTAKGNSKWVRSISKCYMTNGRVNRMAGIFQDITKEKENEDRLIKSKNKILSLNALLSDRLEKTDIELIATKERYGYLYNNAPDLMASIDIRTKRILDCNEQVANTLGYSKEELIGMPLLGIYHKSCHDKVLNTFDKFLKDGFVNDVRLMLEKRDGSKMNVTLNASAIKDEKGYITQTNSVWRDISDLVKTENKLKHFNEELEKRVNERTNELTAANNELEDFTYMATHDLKAPIANVKGHFGIVKTELGITNNKIVDDCFNWIDKSLDLAENKIHSIVRVAQLQFQDIDKAERIDVKSEIKEIINEMSLFISENRANITFVNDDSFEMYFIKDNFKSIFFNLIHNSIKYRQPNMLPEITIKIDSKNPLLSISVSDNGIGFDMEKQESKLFGMFQRLHDHVEGDGMGLHLVKKIIDKSGGSIKVDSEINKGTTFQIYFKK